MPQNRPQPRLTIDGEGIREQLRSPHGPSETQLSDVLHLLRLADQDIDYYSAEILRLESRITFYKSQKERLENHKSLVRSLLSPIRRIPDELLNMIFLYACRGNNCIDLVKSYAGFAFVISSVCARWRDLTLSSSEIWADFGVATINDHKGLDGRARLRPILELYVERSQSRLLTLSFNTSAEKVAKSILLELAPPSSRWKHMTLIVDNFEESMVLFLEQPDFPTMETLTIDQNGPDVQLDLLALIPKLRSLSLDMGWSSLFITTPLDHVTDLEVCVKYGGPGLFQALDFCPNIRNLRVLGGVATPEEHLARVRRDTPMISVLHLSVSLDPRCTVLSSLTTPSLTSLELHASGTSQKDLIESSPFCALNQFFTRSGCALTVLVLEGLSITDVEVVTLLKRLALVVDLTVKDPPSSDGHQLPVTKDFVESLHSYRQSALRTSVQIIVPRLQSLTLGVQSPAFDHESFISMVSSRWFIDKSSASQAGVSCLRSVELFLSKPFDEAKYRPLEQYDKSGMRTVVCRRNWD